MEILPDSPSNNFQLEPFTADQKSQFANLFSKGNSIQVCILATKINRSTFEYHRKQDRWFKAMLDACRDVHCDDLEAIMLQQGKTARGVADRHKYLDAYRPKIFRGKQDSQPVEINITVDKLELEREIQRVQAIEAEISDGYLDGNSPDKTRGNNVGNNPAEIQSPEKTTDDPTEQASYDN